MQVINNPFRVDVVRRNAKTQRTLRNRTDIADIAAGSGQLAADTVCFRQCDNFNILRPE